MSTPPLNTINPMPRSEEDDCALYFRPVPSETKKFFKAECARHGVSMQAAQIEFMRSCKTILPLLKIKKETKAKAKAARR